MSKELCEHMCLIKSIVRKYLCVCVCVLVNFFALRRF